MLYVHHVPGRLRVRSRHLRNNAPALRDLCDGLTAIAGIREAKGNALTGSVLVRYAPEAAPLDAVWERLHRNGITASASPSLPGGPDGLEEAVGKVATFAMKYAVEKLVERSAMAIVAAII